MVATFGNKAGNNLPDETEATIKNAYTACVFHVTRMLRIWPPEKKG